MSHYLARVIRLVILAGLGPLVAGGCSNTTMGQPELGGSDAARVEPSDAGACLLAQRPTGPTGSALSCTKQTPAVPTVAADAADPVRAMAEMQTLQLLDGEIGSYLRGTIGVYRGTFAAHDDPAVGEPSVIPLGPARAQLWGRQLTVWNTCSGDGLSILPGPSTTFSFVRDGINSDPSAIYAGSIANLSGAPTAFAWTDLDATEPVEGFDTVLHVISSASFQPVSPCDLTWVDIAVPFGPLADFSQVGNEMILHAKGIVHVSPPSSNHTCDGEELQFSIDEFVELDDLSNYGVRNFVALQTIALCGA